MIEKQANASAVIFPAAYILNKKLSYIFWTIAIPAAYILNARYTPALSQVNVFFSLYLRDSLKTYVIQKALIQAGECDDFRFSLTYPLHVFSLEMPGDAVFTGITEQNAP